MDIQLPGYETACKNEVYLRDDGFITEDSMPLTEVLLLRRYTLPSEEQMEKYLVKTINNLAAQKARSVPVPSPVEMAIERLLLPETCRHLGIEKCPECLNRIKKLSPALNVEKGNKSPQYLEALYGVIPADLREDNLATGHATQGSEYEAILFLPDFIQHGIGFRFSLSVELEDGAFPRNYKKKTHSGGMANLHALENIVEILKHNFDTVGRIKALRDRSKQILGMMVIETLQNYSKELNCLSAEHTAETSKAAEPEEIPETIKPETAERTPQKERTLPLFALELFKKNKPDNQP